VRPAALLAPVLLAPALLGAPAAAQAPDTEIWLAPLRVEGGVARVGAPTNVTNRVGYDNQPSFTPDGRAILYTAQHDGQTDVWRYDIAARSAAPVTRTPESEYSPAVAPDRRWITVVRVEADSAQRLWRVPLDGRGDAQLLLRDVRPVGYFAWADDATLALFVLGADGAPNTLQVARTRGGGRIDTIMSGVGRSLHRVPGTSTVSFVHVAAAPRVINVVDPSTGAVRRVAQPLEGSEDFAWLDGESILMARGDSLFQHGPGGAGWRLVAALGEIGSVTRLAVSPRGDWLAFVAQSAPMPAPVAPDTGATTVEQPPDVREADVRRHLEVLAADSMMGRLTGTPGIHKAARYVAEQFAALGLRPAGDSTGAPWASYLQRVPLRVDSAGARPRLLPSWAAFDTVPAARRLVDANVVGMIPGSDPALRDEVVLVTAHYDHVGTGRPVDPDSLRIHRRILALRPPVPRVQGQPPQPPAPLSAAEQATFRRQRDSVLALRPARLDSIFNGADDDASGTVGLIEIARAMLAGPPPKRTVIFAAMTGEERGLLGTNWYLAHPVVPLERTVANLNVEMIGRPDSLAGGPGKAWLTGYERSTMGDVLAANAIPLVPDPRPEQSFFTRSDNIGFARRGIPAHTISSFDLHVDYHQVTDDVDAIDFAHMTQVIAATARATRLLSDGAKPEWHPGGRP